MALGRDDQETFKRRRVDLHGNLLTVGAYAQT